MTIIARYNFYTTHKEIVENIGVVKVLKEWIEDFLCKHEFESKSALVDRFGKRECICCRKCGVKRMREIKFKEKSD